MRRRDWSPADGMLRGRIARWDEVSEPHPGPDTDRRAVHGANLNWDEPQSVSLEVVSNWYRYCREEARKGLMTDCCPVLLVLLLFFFFCKDELD